jgi:hypothetical protein
VSVKDVYNCESPLKYRRFFWFLNRVVGYIEHEMMHITVLLQAVSDDTKRDISELAEA